MDNEEIQETTIQLNVIDNNFRLQSYSPFYLKPSFNNSILTVLRVIERLLSVCVQNFKDAAHKTRMWFGPR